MKAELQCDFNVSCWDDDIHLGEWEGKGEVGCKCNNFSLRLIVSDYP